MSEWHEKTDLPWMKVHMRWWRSPSHLELGPTALYLGLALMGLANERGRSPDGSGWVLGAKGGPMSDRALANFTRLPIDEVRTSVQELIECGTMVRREEDGALGFDSLQKWQEDPSTRRKRVQRAQHVRGHSAECHGNVRADSAPDDPLSLCSSEDLSSSSGGSAEGGESSDVDAEAIVEAWNAGCAEGSNVKPIAGRPSQKKAIRAAVKSCGEWRDPDAWRWAAYAMSRDEHQGKRWTKSNRFGWLLDPKRKYERLGQWIDAGQEVKTHGLPQAVAPPRRETVHDRARARTQAALQQVAREVQGDDADQRRDNEGSGRGAHRRSPLSLLAPLGGGTGGNVG